MVSAAFMGIGKAAPLVGLLVVKMWSSLPQTMDGDLGNEDGGLFSNIFLLFDGLGEEDVTPFFLNFS